MSKINSIKCLLAGILWISVFAGSSPTAFGQFDPDGSGKPSNDIHPTDVIHWQPVGAFLYLDNSVEVNLRLITEQNFTLYTDKVSFAAPEGFKIVRVEKPPLKKQYDPISAKEVEVYAGGEFKIFMNGLEKWQEKQFPFEVTFLGCTTRICLFPFTQKLSVPIFASTEKSPLSQTSNTPTLDVNEAPATEGLDEQLAERFRSGEFGLLMMILVVFAGGLLTNATPCVAPMIPITIRLLANQKHSPLVNSSLYAGGIMVTYTMIGTLAVFSGSAFGSFMSSAPLNIAFSLVMAMLGFSMLGFFDLTFLQTMGSKIGGGKPSAKNTFMMGAAAGLVAAPCTGPVLGALLAYTTGKANPAEGVALMATYSFGFALPYVFLGGAAGKISAIKINPFFQIFIKVLFAGVMFGLALYYMRVPLYDTVKALREHWDMLAGMTMAGGAVLTVLWLGVPKLRGSKLAMLALAIVLGFGLFFSSQYLTSGESELYWHTDLNAAIEAGKKENKPIFMDNWAEWCEACKKMEKTTFETPGIAKEFDEHWILLKIDLTEGTDADDSHMEKYGISGLPTLVLLPPDGDVEKSSSIVGFVGSVGLKKRLDAFKKRL